VLGEIFIAALDPVHSPVAAALQHTAAH